jgi:hypothetical protein
MHGSFHRHKRNPQLKLSSHPVTPDAHDRQLSKRAWDGVIRVWRRLLHAYDPVGAADAATTTAEAGSAQARNHSTI